MKANLAVFLLTCLFGLGECQPTKKPTKNDTVVYPDDVVEYIYNYRVVNWCVTGNNEPALYEWPLVQFKPFLIRTSNFQTPADFVRINLNDTNFKTGDDLQDYSEQILDNLPPDVTATAELSFKKFWCDGFGYDVTRTDTEDRRPDKSTVKMYNKGVPPQRQKSDPNPNSIFPVPAPSPPTEHEIPFPYNYMPLSPIGHHLEKATPSTPSGLYYKYRPSEVMGGHLHQRIHIELKLTNPGNEDAFHGAEGILIQANHQPFGMGFPFGQFYRGEDTEDSWSCNCRFNTHRIIPCLSRPDVEILLFTDASGMILGIHSFKVHSSNQISSFMVFCNPNVRNCFKLFETQAPTVAAFHYEMNKYTKNDVDDDWDYPKKKIKVGRQKEFHFNFKWHSHPCSSANVVEFFVLIVYDFYRRHYEIKKFGPYDFSPLNIHKDEYVKFGAKAGDKTHFEAQESRFNNLKWLMPVSHPVPDPLGSPTALPRLRTKAGSRTGYVQNPLYMPSPIFPHCRIKSRTPKLTCVVPENDNAGLPVPYEIPNNYCQDEYFMSCHDTPIVFPQMWRLSPRFPLIPPPAERPYEGYFTNEVPYGPAGSPTRTADTESKGPSLRFNGRFDVDCITNYPLEKEAHRQCPEWSGKYRCDTRYASRGNRHTYKEILESNVRMQTDVKVKVAPEADQFFKNTLCEPCKYEPTTQFSAPQTTPTPVFKRSPHGALMVVAFLYLMPMSNLIARHYKETFHTWEIKGFRTWLWVHIFLSIFSMLLAYAGYNLETFWVLDTHMYLGYACMFSGGLGLITGWGRHKLAWARYIMFVLHSIPSYAAVVCAACCYLWSPVSFLSGWIMSAALIGFAVVIFAMDCNVFCEDRRVGMRPRRSHIPIFQVRFEDALGRSYRSRFVFLCIFCVIYLGVIVLMMFF